MKIAKLIIKNFRAINAGSDGSGIQIELDDHSLIFLSGKNNSGKSCILSAYEKFVSSKAIATIDDFYNKETTNNIYIEAWIKAENEEDRNHRALSNWWDENGIAKIRKIWTEEDKVGAKESYHPEDGWVSGGAGGFDTLLQNACPTPVWIRGMSTPQDVIDLLQTLVKDTILARIKETEVYENAIGALNNLQEAIENDEYTDQIESRLNNAISSIFPEISFQIKNEGDYDFSGALKKYTNINVSETDKPILGLESHGHGIRRQFILSAFRGLSDQFDETQKPLRQRNKNNYSLEEELGDTTHKTKMLLIEEPELFLHPDAIRAVKELIYLLANNAEFQVMAATHLPLMVDLSKPHTTLVRVVNDAERGTLIYQVPYSLFENEERERLKMLNKFDPYVCEAFFSECVVLVEGDTEAIAMRTLINRIKTETDMEPTKEIHIVNCGSKMNIPFFQKILIHFNIDHYVIHDVDAEHTQAGNVNPAWTLNSRIWDKILEAQNNDVEAKRMVFFREFESAHNFEFDKTLGKPFSAFQQVSNWDIENLELPLIKYTYVILGNLELENEFSPEVINEVLENEL
jgi:putative ATP-dependent endonuclease of the OLD family